MAHRLLNLSNVCRSMDNRSRVTKQALNAMGVIMPENARPIPKEGVAALRGLVKLGRERIERLARVIAGIGPTLAPADVRAKLMQKVDTSFAACEELIVILEDAVLPLASIQHRLGLAPAAFLEVVSTWLKHVPSEEWPDESASTWEREKQAIGRLLALEAFSVEDKARYLLEDRPNWMQSSSLLSELRPVPDETGEQVHAMLIVNTLSIRYRSGNTVRTATFSLDPVDLDDLEYEVFKAKNLNATLKKKLDRDKIPALMLGSDEDSEVSDSETSGEEG